MGQTYLWFWIWVTCCWIKSLKIASLVIGTHLWCSTTDTFVIWKGINHKSNQEYFHLAEMLKIFTSNMKLSFDFLEMCYKSPSKQRVYEPILVGHFLWLNQTGAGKMYHGRIDKVSLHIWLSHHPSLKIIKPYWLVSGFSGRIY